MTVKNRYIQKLFGNIDFKHHWIELLIADLLVCFGAGIGAAFFNAGAGNTILNLGTLAAVTGVYTLAYLLSYCAFRTYNSFKSNIGHAEILRCMAAVLMAVVLIILFRKASGYGVTIYTIREVALQALFTLIGMLAVRTLVKVHYSFYHRRGSESPAYGMSDIALLNLEMKDLLQRQPIKVDSKKIAEYLEGRTILITGGAGSIGSELARLIASYKPAKIILIDQAETPLYQLRINLHNQYPKLDFTTIVMNVCHSHRLDYIFGQYKPEIVFHAAAYKHVPMLEDNVVESILNNVDATVKLADMAIKHGVEKFVLISTDKAVNPTNIMGCSKRICEIYCQSLARSLGDESTRFITTRFGNVLGSNGSVVPLFREQIRKGGPVTVTHPDIIRYFMLIPEACMLVLEAAVLGQGAEVFAFDMGEPVRIADLARKMIELSGKNNIRITYTGLREGEKLFEEVFDENEEMLPTSHKKIKIAKVREYEYAVVKEQIMNLLRESLNYDTSAIIRMMKELVPEFTPRNTRKSSNT